ncbi:MAG: hypothetical protein HYV90_04165 [Candidatus Woesebacteria bacterium]|nr:MAG: hypothetical protein HYV90_04165 [Candidatus Woesebacteria bacterium]
MKGIFKGIITIAIGGTIFTISQTDLAKNFSKETGLTQEQAQQYVENIKDEDLASFDKIGSDFVSDGKGILSTNSSIDCVNYTYEWESSVLTCQKGKSQLATIGNDEIALGQAYIKLASDSATRDDISKVISLIDRLNTDLKFEIVTSMLSPQTIDEMRKSNSYNKALLQTALESKQ